jgi:hypothetical protein
MPAPRNARALRDFMLVDPASSFFEMRDDNKGGTCKLIYSDILAHNIYIFFFHAKYDSISCSQSLNCIYIMPIYPHKVLKRPKAEGIFQRRKKGILS